MDVAGAGVVAVVAAVEVAAVAAVKDAQHNRQAGILRSEIEESYPTTFLGPLLDERY